MVLLICWYHVGVFRVVGMENPFLVVGPLAGGPAKSRLPPTLRMVVRLIWLVLGNVSRSGTHSSDPCPAKGGGLVVLGRVDGQLLIAVVRLSPPGRHPLRVARNVLDEPLDEGRLAHTEFACLARQSVHGGCFKHECDPPWFDEGTSTS